MLLKESPMVFYPSTAVKLGLVESIFLQQVHYWLLKSKNIVEGKPWIYNTLEEWHKQLPFVSVMTLRRVIAKLKGEGYLITAHHNKKGYDRTSWYTLNYEKLGMASCVQNEQMDSFKMNTPIPLDYTKTGNKKTKKTPDTSMEIYLNGKDSICIPKADVEQARQHWRKTKP